MPDTLADAVRRMESCDKTPCLSLSELAAKFADMPPYRICFDPLPGHAAEQDIIDGDVYDRLFELVDGTLIEKTFNAYDAFLAGNFIHALHGSGKRSSFGAVLGGRCAFRLRPGFVAMPDVSLFTFERARQLRHAEPHDPPIVGTPPNLVVELINAGNTRTEMRVKLHEYFAAGVQEVWYVYSKSNELHQFLGPEDYRVLKHEDTLTSPQLLSGFECRVSRLLRDPFARVANRG